MKMFGQTAKISWETKGTKDAEGVYSPGVSRSIETSCNIQPVNGSFKRGPDGDQITYEYKIYTPAISDYDEIPDGAKIEIFNKEFMIVQKFKYPKHCEFKAG